MKIFQNLSAILPSKSSSFSMFKCCKTATQSTVTRPWLNMPTNKIARISHKKNTTITSHSSSLSKSCCDEIFTAMSKDLPHLICVMSLARCTLYVHFCLLIVNSIQHGTSTKRLTATLPTLTRCCFPGELPCLAHCCRRGWLFRLCLAVLKHLIKLFLSHIHFLKILSSFQFSAVKKPQKLIFSNLTEHNFDC